MTDPGIAEEMEKLQQQLDRLDKSKQETDARFARLDGLKEEMESLEATVTSSDRAVTVVAGPGGGVKSIKFSEEARKLSPTQLSSAATSTLQQAVAQAARQQAEIVQGHLGDSSNVLERVMKTQEEIFGATPAGEAEQAPQPEQPPRGDQQARHDPPPAPPQASAAPRHSAPRPSYEDDYEEEGMASIFEAEPQRPSRPSQPPRRDNRENDDVRLFEEGSW